MQTDYYAILGVTRSASAEEIKAAYRRLARRYHPDTSGGEPGAEDRFKEITLAYQVLRDMDQRVRYDLAAMERELEATEREFAAEVEGNGSNGTPAPAVHLGDTLPPHFGETASPHAERDAPEAPAGRRAGLFQRFGRRRGNAAEASGERVRGEDLEAVAQIALEEAIRGCTATVAVAGSERGANGGAEDAARTIEVRVPKLAVDGQRLRVKGEGAAGENGGARGDLHVTVAYKRHRLFRLLGTDVWFYLPIAPWEAVLGAVVDIPTLEKPFRVHVPAGATSGKTFRLPGRGLPKPDGGRGDLLACLRIITPEFPTETEKQLYLQLARVSRFNARRGFG